MPNFPQPQRQDWSAVTDDDLAALLAGKVGAAPGLRPVADILAALTAGATAGEFAGEARALAAFRRRTGARASRRAARRAPAGLAPRLGAKAAAAATAAAVVFGGAATAAYANVLPAPIQRLAHETIGAPTPHPRPGLLPHGGSGTHGGHAHGDHAAYGQAAARGPHAQEQGSPGATPPGPGAQGAGSYGGPHGTGTRGSPHGQQGAGQAKQGGGQGQQGTGQSQSAVPDPVGLYGSLHFYGQRCDPQTQEPGRLRARHGTAGEVPGRGGAMEDRRGHMTSSGPVPRPGCGVVAVRWAGWPA